MFVIDGDHKNLSYIHQEALSRQDFDQNGTTVPELKDFDAQNGIAVVGETQPGLKKLLPKGLAAR